MSTVDSQLIRRNATLPDLVTLLRQQHAAKLDVVVPAAGIRVRRRLSGRSTAPATPSSARTASPRRPAGSPDRRPAMPAIADKLGIPAAYLRRLRAEHLGLYDANVNGWLEHAARPAAARPRLCAAPTAGRTGSRGRCCRSGTGSWTTSTCCWPSWTASAAPARTSRCARCDLTERRMYVQIASQSVAARPDAAGGYVSPFTGARGADNPLVFAGFVLSNSETGHGSFSITPRLIVQVCANGYTITKDAMREVHLGGRLGEGVVHWSADTQRAAVDLIARQATDATATFLTSDYLTPQPPGHRGPRRHSRSEDARGTIHYVGSQLRFTEDQQNTILDHYIGAGQTHRRRHPAGRHQRRPGPGRRRRRLRDGTRRRPRHDPRRRPPALNPSAGRAATSPGARSACSPPRPTRRHRRRRQPGDLGWAAGGSVGKRPSEVSVHGRGRQRGGRNCAAVG